jgi:hypothetical protein
MVVNDNAGHLTLLGVFTTIANKGTGRNNEIPSSTMESCA